MDNSADDSGPELMGECPALGALRTAVARAARVDAPVLISGETGTGKELVAQLLHRQSRRADKPFVAVNCAALPEGLFQAEVFGYERGAFTGAERAHPGRVATAAGGSLMLDEIGDLPLDNQVVLLRFLEQGIYEPLGSSRSVSADVRIIAATHVDLAGACRSGGFREDLYYRLGVLQLEIPPLRERGDDLLLMARHFIRSFSRQYGVNERALSDAAIRAMRRHAWPGNVRELRNRVLQALVMSETGCISAGSLGLEGPSNCETASGGVTVSTSLRASRKLAERMAIERALEATRGNVQAAAERLKVSRAQLYRLIKDHHLESVFTSH